MTTELAYDDRTTKPLSQKLNPVWWFKNDDEQTLEQAPWYMPDAPQWLRVICWNARNPLQNFRAYVVGVQDRNYSVQVLKGNPDPSVVQRNDVGEKGFQVATLNFANGLKLPFVSYSGEKITWYAGWQPSGFFGVKFNVTA